MYPFQLFFPLVAWSVTANGQLSDFFFDITRGDYLIIGQCKTVEFNFGGGMPPYFIEVRSYYDNQLYSAVSVDSPGKVHCRRIFGPKT
jgi:hypothetical protein